MIRIVLYVLVLAALVYAVFWAIDRRSSPGGRGGGRTVRPPGPKGPKGPDDDEAFLRDLERKRRREQGDPPQG